MLGILLLLQQRSERYPECVAWLLDQGCDPSCQDAQGKEALFCSIENGDEPTVKLLAGRSPMAPKEMLNSAIRSRQGKIMEWLMGQFSLSAQEALFQAIAVSSLDCAKRLVKPGVVYDATDLLSRISLSEKDMVEWCLTLAPDINRTNHAGRTFIQESVRGGHLDAAKLIADKNPTLDLTAMKKISCTWQWHPDTFPLLNGPRKNGRDSLNNGIVSITHP